MKILRKYLLKELLGPFMLSLSVLIFIMLTATMLIGKTNIFGLVIGKGVSLALVLKLILLSIPNLLSWGIPFSLLIATLLVIGRLSADNEIVAIRASGINLYKLCFPIMVIGLITSLASIPLNDRLKPNALFTSRKIIKQIGFKSPTAFLEAGTFIRTFKGYIIYICEIDDKKLSNIRIWQPQEKGSTRIIIANKGEFKAYPKKDIIKLKLMDGSSDEPNPNDPNAFYKLNFKTYFLTLDLSGGMQNLQKKLKDKSIRELRREIRELKKEGIEKVEDIAPIITEINKKLSFSFSCLAFVLIGVPLAISTRRREKLVGIGVSVAIMIGYYGLFLVGQVLSARGFVHPGLGVWLSDIVLISAGLILIIHTMKR
jgi:lipopolysaccharide export system permease protein